MNKPEQVKELAKRLKTTQVDAADILETTYGMIAEFFEGGGESFRLGELGTLKRKVRKERNYVDIHTKESKVSPEHYTLSFTPASGLKEAINELYETA